MREIPRYAQAQEFAQMVEKVCVDRVGPAARRQKIEGLGDGLRGVFDRITEKAAQVECGEQAAHTLLDVAHLVHLPLEELFEGRFLMVAYTRPHGGGAVGEV